MMEQIHRPLQGRVALVTGASRGIGRATCLAFAAQGAAVAVHYRVEVDQAADVVASIRLMGAMAEVFSADFSRSSAPLSLVQQVTSYFGRLDILVNNAGEMTGAPLLELNDALWEQTLNVNLGAAFRTIQAAVPYMKVQRWGRIINVTSQAAYTGSVNHAHYAASKAGLAGLTYSLAKELGPSGVTVNMIAPGRIATDMIRDQIPLREEEWLRQTPLGRLGQPEEVAAAIAFLASPAASYITGATLHVNGGVVMS
jgi:3-oxoacyl-[acyl-carrier protein] reductase